MYYLNDLCCICLCSRKDVCLLSDIDKSRKSYYSKLTAAVRGMYYREINEQRLVCSSCCQDINFVYKFHLKCVSSETRLGDYMARLQAVSQQPGTIYVRLVDFRKQPVKQEQPERVEEPPQPFSEERLTTPDSAFCQVTIKEEQLDFDLGNEDVGWHDAETDGEDIARVKCEVVSDSTAVSVPRCQDPLGDAAPEPVTSALRGPSNPDDERGPSLSCRTCHKEFVQKGSLRRHERLQLCDTPHECTVCGKRFSRKSGLDVHARIHGEKPYGCSVCGKRFVTNYKVIMHTRTHTGEKPHTCHLCGRRFAQRIHLLSHVQTHSEDKPYECAACGKRFVRKEHVTKHMRTHTGEKPYACELCGVGFAQKISLAVHRRIHTGERPFSCEACGKTFTQNSHLYNHRKMHSGEKPHRCPTCGKRFNRKEHMAAHARIHSGEKPYVCQHCGGRFGHKVSLVRHMRFHVGAPPVGHGEPASPPSPSAGHSEPAISVEPLPVCADEL